MYAPIPDDTEVRDRLPSVTPDFTGSLGGKTGIPLSGFGKPVTGDIYLLHVDSLIPDDTEVRDRSPSETPGLPGDLGGKTGILRDKTGIPCLGVLDR